MTIFFNLMSEAQFGYAAVFACISLCFFFLKLANKEEVGPGYWSGSFLSNSIGFLLWSGVFPGDPRLSFLIGEIFHITGFFLLVCGIYRFSGREYKKWNVYAIASWIVVWIASIALIPHSHFFASLLLKSLRAVLFIWTGINVLKNKSIKDRIGKNLTGWSLIVWGLYVAAFAVIVIDRLRLFAYGLLVGFQVLASFGMVIMLIDRVIMQAKEKDATIKKLEGLLPICSYCKKIRDKNNKWHVLEAYIEERSAAEFSHGICPDCFEKYHPDLK